MALTNSPDKSATSSKNVDPAAAQSTAQGQLTQETPQKKAADQGAGDAALGRLAGPAPQTASTTDAKPPATDAPGAHAAPTSATAGAGAKPLDAAKDAPKVEAFDATAQVKIQQAEAVVTKVVDNRPVFTVTARVPLSQLAGPTVTAQELRQIADAQLFAGPGATSFVWKQEGDSLVLVMDGMVSTNSLNASSFSVTTGDGKRVALTVQAAQFHTDNAEWERAGLRLAIAQSESGIAQFEKQLAGDEAIAKDPAKADVTADNARLAATLTKLDGVNAQIAARIAELKPQFAAMEQHAEVEALVGAGLGGDATAQAMAGEGKALDVLVAQRDHVDGQLADARNQADVAHQVADGVGSADTRAQAQAADAKVQQLTAQRAQVDAQAQAAAQKIFTEIDAQNAYAERLLSQYEGLIRSRSGQSLPPGVAVLGGLLGQRQFGGLDVDIQRRAIAAKLAEPAKVQAAAKSRVVDETGTVASQKAQLAKEQAALAAIKGPVFVMLGPDGQALPPPKAGPAKA